MEATALVLQDVTLQKVQPSMRQQILIAMDGRTFRSFSLDVRILESEFSRKMTGKSKFTQDEIDRINIRLKSKIVFEQE